MRPLTYASPCTLLGSGSRDPLINKKHNSSLTVSIRDFANITLAKPALGIASMNDAVNITTF